MNDRMATRPQIREVNEARGEKDDDSKKQNADEIRGADSVYICVVSPTRDRDISRCDRASALEAQHRRRSLTHLIPITSRQSRATDCGKSELPSGGCLVLRAANGAAYVEPRRGRAMWALTVVGLPQRRDRGGRLGRDVWDATSRTPRRDRGASVNIATFPGFHTEDGYTLISSNMDIRKHKLVDTMRQGAFHPNPPLFTPPRTS